MKVLLNSFHLNGHTLGSTDLNFINNNNNAGIYIALLPKAQSALQHFCGGLCQIAYLTFDPPFLALSRPYIILSYFLPVFFPTQFISASKLLY